MLPNICMILFDLHSGRFQDLLAFFSVQPESATSWSRSNERLEFSSPPSDRQWDIKSLLAGAIFPSVNALVMRFEFHPQLFLFAAVILASA